ncbi:MAG: cell division protein FtsL [Proteobacteria bacterium]|nr:cell division protein FtsL [Pseudomonadota bacterium]
MRNSVLAILIMVSAVSVISLRHHSRLYFGELQQLHSERDALNTEWGKLMLEEGAWSQHQRIEKTAQKRLNMALPKAGQVRIIERNGKD